MVEALASMLGKVSRVAVRISVAIITRRSRIACVIWFHPHGGRSWPLRPTPRLTNGSSRRAFPRSVPGAASPPGFVVQRVTEPTGGRRLVHPCAHARAPATPWEGGKHAMVREGGSDGEASVGRFDHPTGGLRHVANHQ